MSTAHTDISDDLITGIFTVLDGNVTYSEVTYPVYKSIPKTPASVYIHVHNVLDKENGTKDDFIYEGTVQVEVVNEGQQRADMKLVRKIRGVVRGLLKATKGATFSIGDDHTLVVFRAGASNEGAEFADNGITKLRLIDMYEFIIE